MANDPPIGLANATLVEPFPPKSFGGAQGLPTLLRTAVGLMQGVGADYPTRQPELPGVGHTF